MIVYSLTAQEFANKLFDQFVNPIIIFLVMLSIFLILFYGAKMLLTSSADEKINYKWKLFYSVIGFSVIVSIWTIFTLIGNIVGTDVKVNKNSSSGSSINQKNDAGSKISTPE